MRLLKLLLIASLAFSVTACDSLRGENSIFRRQDDSYLHNDQSVNPMYMPGDLNDYRMNNYYNVPNAPRSRGNRAPSVAPPDGSGKYRKYKDETYVKKATKPTAAVAANKATAPVGKGEVTLQQKPQKVWANLDTALKKAGYRVMDKDSSVNSYFVLDVPSTQGKVKRSTPVYQLRVQDDDGATALSLLNAKGKPADAAVSKRILTAVSKNIT